MKVAVINLSGNTGKTTLSKHLLAPQLGARRIQIEDVNTSDGEPDLELAAGRFKQLAAELNAADDDESFVIDIGASNAKLMVEQFSQLRTTRADIDFWVVPVVPAAKQKADSINTVATLMKIGVAADRIVMVLNNVIDTDAIETDFAAILATRELGVNVTDQVVLASEVFEMMKGQNESVFDIAGNRPDFKALLKAARADGNTEEVKALGERMVVQDMAEAASENLKAVFDSTPIAAAAAPSRLKKVA